MNFTPSKHPVQDFKASVRMAARQAYQGAPLAGPIRIVATFVMPRPGRLRWKTRPMPRCLHASKPDIENVAKAIFDALTGLAWNDDAQIAITTLTKVYAAGDEQPCVEVEIWEIMRNLYGR